MKFKVNGRGVEGVLLQCMGTYVFRVYNKKRNTFVDYDLHHSDLSVTITDEDACFYQDDEREEFYLDHMPSTLGRTDNDPPDLTDPWTEADVTFAQRGCAFILIAMAVGIIAYITLY